MTTPGSHASLVDRVGWFFVPCLGITAVWLAATHLPDPERVGIRVGRHDTAVHAAGYMVMTFSWLFWALTRPGSRIAPRTAVVCVSMIVLAGLDELTQPLVGRDAAWADWIADTLGTVAAAFAAVPVVSWRLRTRQAGTHP